MKKVFIDGKAGTTGLRIFDRLSLRKDIEIMSLKEEERKDAECRRNALNSCDIAFLCLPDDAAREALSMVTNKNVKILDTSTAHRTDADFAYGFPELSEKMHKNIKEMNKIAVPGCHASGFIALVYPLIESGVISAETYLTCHSITGYSGGGKKMIAQYEAEVRDFRLDAPRQYGIAQNHKHLKEMVKISGIAQAPVFCPIVSDYSGMTVTVPLFKKDIVKGDINYIKEVYKEKYNGKIVSCAETPSEDGFISAAELSGKDSMRISVAGNDDRILLVAMYDNLGKGASGAAIECMNIALGEDETKGLII